MSDFRFRTPAPTRSNPTVAIPDSQARALDRRHSLDQQQRAFAYRDPNSASQWVQRRRPA